MSEFKGTKSYKDLVKENKEMLEMLKDILDNEHLGLNKDAIRQLIKQATQPT